MKRSIIVTLAIAALAAAPAVFGQSTATGSSTLDITVAPEASFTTNTPTTTLSGDTQFGAKTGTTSFTYKIRTSQTSGTGSITVRVADFGADGPALLDLTYGSSVPAPATTAGASGLAVSTAAEGTEVATFGADAHSTDGGDAGTITWTLVDRTGVKTGNYTSTAVFTISAS